MTIVSNIRYAKQNFSCIYKIQSKKNRKCYIGSAKHFGIRRRNHLYQLKNNKHHSIILQNHVNKYGIEDVFFEILEICDWSEQIAKKEQYYIDLFTPEFNVLRTAHSTFGRKITEETRRKLVESHLGKKQSLETRLKRTESCKRAMQELTPQQIENRRRGARTRWRKVICLQTNVVYESINEAERETGCANVWMICNGVRPHSRGKTFKYV